MIRHRAAIKRSNQRSEFVIYYFNRPRLISFMICMMTEFNAAISASARFSLASCRAPAIAYAIMPASMPIKATNDKQFDQCEAAFRVTVGRGSFHWPLGQFTLKRIPSKIVMLSRLKSLAAPTEAALVSWKRVPRNGVAAKGGDAVVGTVTKYACPLG